jgi:predicted flap endonuclease-1-like 5' DNA nuclease
MTDLPRGLGAPAERAFAQAGYTTLEQFVEVSEKDLLRLHGVGPKAVRLLREQLTSHNLTFRNS